MKIIINVKDSKAAFFLELLQSFDFITIDKTADSGQLSKETKDLLDKRIRDYQNNSSDVQDWKSVKRNLEKDL